jgi:hypothetical protein
MSPSPSEWVRIRCSPSPLCPGKTVRDGYLFGSPLRRIRRKAYYILVADVRDSPGSKRKELSATQVTRQCGRVKKKKPAPNYSSHKQKVVPAILFFIYGYL